MPKRRRTKGRGQIVKSGRLWGVKYTEDGARRWRGGFLTRDQAEQASAEIAANLAAGRPGTPRPPAGRVTIGDLVARWFEDREGMRSIGDDRNRWRRHLAPVVEARPIGDLTTADVQALKVRLLKGARAAGASPAVEPLDPATVERVLYTLSAFYRWAIRAGHTEANPVKVYLAGLNPSERRQLRSQHDPTSTPFIERPEDVAKIVKALPRPMNVAYALTAAAGLRPGEALALEWADVDLERGTAKIRHQVRHGKLGPPKSGRPRSVPLVPGLVSLLKEWRALCVSPLVVPPLRRGKAHMGAGTVQGALAEALARLKLPSMTWYQSGRHTFASQWVLAGLDIYRLSQIMGHASVVTTQRYAHLSAKTPSEMLARIDLR